MSQPRPCDELPQASRVRGRLKCVRPGFPSWGVDVNVQSLHVQAGGHQITTHTQSLSSSHQSARGCSSARTRKWALREISKEKQKPHILETKRHFFENANQKQKVSLRQRWKKVKQKKTSFVVFFGTLRDFSARRKMFLGKLSCPPLFNWWLLLSFPAFFAAVALLTSFGQSVCVELN